MTSILFSSRRFPSGVTLFLILAVLLYAGCRERGSDLVQDQGPERANSAAVANQATAPQPLEPDRAVAESTHSSPSPSGSFSAGVERGFADASGGATLPHTVQGLNEPAPASSGAGLEARVQAIVRELEDDLRGATVQVEQGRVVLQGTVASREVAEDLTARLREVRGVESVDNQLEVREPQPAE